MIVKSGYVFSGEFAGKPWEIELIGKEHYRLIIDGEFYASSDNQHQLLDELTVLEVAHSNKEG